MKRLSERFVQEAALDALHNYYIEKYQLETPPFSEPECRTVKNGKDGGKRADGLLVFRKDDQFFTVSMEAKSHKTLKSLFPYTNWKKLDNFTAVLLVFGIVVFGASLYFLWNALPWYWVIVISVIVLFSLLILMGFGLNVFEKRNLNAEIIDQLKYYPANDQWLAFSADAKELLNERNNIYNSLETNENYEELRRIAAKHGFGLILVEKQSVEFVVYPKTRKGDFLFKYSKKDEIVQQLSN